MMFLYLKMYIFFYKQSLGLYFETEYTKFQKSISKLKSLEEEAEKKIIAINEINNKRIPSHKSINSITLIEEENSERISTNESNDKHVILVSNTGHVIKKRKIKRNTKDFSIDNNQELQIKNLYNNQIVLENTIFTHTKQMNDILLEKEINIRKKLLTKAIQNNRKVQEMIKKEKIQKYFSNKNNESNQQTGPIITMFGSCAPNKYTNTNDIINTYNTTNNINKTIQEDENCVVV